MEIRTEVPLAPLTTFKAGGPAEYYATVRSPEELQEALAWAGQREQPVTILGGGSNVLIDDAGLPGLTIQLSLQGVSFSDPRPDGTVTVEAAAGEDWDALVERSVQRELGGLENLSGIPGRVGAAPVQNIGAYGREVKDSVCWVEAVHIESGERRRFAAEECGLAYRHSFFKTAAGRSWVITRVALTLSPSDQPELRYRDLAEHFPDRSSAPALAEIRRAVLTIRSRKFPDPGQWGTAGSFFTNPLVSQEKLASLRRRWPDLPAYEVDQETVKISAAWLLDQACGLKGYRRGPVRLFERQPLVVVAEPGAAAAEVKVLAEEVQSAVRARTGVELTREVRYLPEEGEG